MVFLVLEADLEPSKFLAMIIDKIHTKMSTKKMRLAWIGARSDSSLAR